MVADVCCGDEMGVVEECLEAAEAERDPVGAHRP
jgi:hypothetical protein